MKRFALILLLLVGALTSSRGATHPGDDLITSASAAFQAGKLDEAIALDEQVLTQHAEASNRWFDAQMGITQALARKGDLAGAAQAAHLCLDGAMTLPTFDSAVVLTANILSALDKKVDRANQFIAFEQTGTGTNPMDAVGYPAMPQREKAFTLMRQQAGNDAAASRLRALTYLFSGQPKDALAQFAEAFRRNDKFFEFSNGGVDLVCVGLRAVRGHRVGLDKDMQFVIFGPNGPDGKPNTADDLADPFAPFLPAPPPPGQGGLSGISVDDLALLRQVRDAAQLYAGDPLLPASTRRPALLALQRATDAVDGWGAPGQKDWYVHLALGIDSPAPDYSYLTGAELAARGRDTNYGGVRALWNEVEATMTAKGITPPVHALDARAQFDKACAALGELVLPQIALNPLQTPATF